MFTQRLSLLAILALLLAACGQAGTAANPTAGSAGAAATAPAGAAATVAPGGAAATAPAAGAATTAPAGETGGATGTIQVGSKNFTEALITGELYALLLEDAGFEVERKFDLGATPVAQAALASGDIDLYPEYTSTGLLEVLQQEPIFDRTELLTALRSEYESQFQLTWLEPSAFNNTNTFAVTADTATRLSLKTYSDLFAKAGEVRLGGPPEFPERQDTKNLETIYGGPISGFAEYSQLGTGSLRYDALKNGDVDAIVAFGTDGRIRVDNLVILEDDKQAYPSYSLAPVVRQDKLAEFPQIADALNVLAPLLTDSAMQDLNYQVDGPDAKEYAAVAQAFLEQNNLLTR
ncbi:MAG: quaternary ammonium transporter [Roseiflexaceae bacterium]|nr:quaternary ammonium transporter [Roseiflexaceae bacterium]